MIKSAMAASNVKPGTAANRHRTRSPTGLILILIPVILTALAGVGCGVEPLATATPLTPEPANPVASPTAEQETRPPATRTEIPSTQVVAAPVPTAPTIVADAATATVTGPPGGGESAALRFQPDTMSLTAEGQRKTVSVVAEGVPSGANGLQISIQHSDALAIRDVECAGLFQEAMLVGPTELRGATGFTCILLGEEVAGGEGLVAAFTVERTGQGNEVLTLGTDPQEGTFFALGGVAAQPSITGALTVTGLAAPTPTPRPEDLLSDEELQRRRDEQARASRRDADLRSGVLDGPVFNLMKKIGTAPPEEIAALAPVSRGDRISVEIYYDPKDPGAVDSVTEFLLGLGVEDFNAASKGVIATVPVEALPELAFLAGVRFVKFVDLAILEDEISSLGNAVTHSWVWQDVFLTGSGVRVGIIDLGFDGFSASQQAGELPASGIQFFCYRDDDPATQPSSSQSDCEFGSEDHGTQVTETLIDTAPGVELYIARCFTLAQLTEVVEWMNAPARRVKVVNTSFGLGYSLGPGDGTSPSLNSPYDAIDLITSSEALGGSDAVWIKSAGNRGDKSWWAENPSFTGADQKLVFDPSGGGDTGYTFEVLDGYSASVGIRWHGPVFGAPTTDLDLHLYLGQDEVASAVGPNP